MSEQDEESLKTRKNFCFMNNLSSMKVNTYVPVFKNRTKQSKMSPGLGENQKSKKSLSHHRNK